ncbi:MAG: Jag family protein [Anaerolineales bacterium]
MVDEPTTEPTSSADSELTLAQQALQDILARMKLIATTTAEWGEPDVDDGTRTILLNVQGEDLGGLIGRRGETLNALQLILRMMLSKQLLRGVSVAVDVEHFRERRLEQLRRMARKTAEQVVERQRPIALEPMSPDERRLIHIELRDHPDVRTESTGEGNRRKVQIIPK